MGNRKRISVTVSEEIAAAFEAYCRGEGIEVASLLRDAALAKIGRPDLSRAMKWRGNVTRHYCLEAYQRQGLSSWYARVVAFDLKDEFERYRDHGEPLESFKRCGWQSIWNGDGSVRAMNSSDYGSKAEAVTALRVAMSRPTSCAHTYGQLPPDTPIYTVIDGVRKLVE